MLQVAKAAALGEADGADELQALVANGDMARSSTATAVYDALYHPYTARQVGSQVILLGHISKTAPRCIPICNPKQLAAFLKLGLNLEWTALIGLSLPCNDQPADMLCKKLGWEVVRLMILVDA